MRHIVIGEDSQWVSWCPEWWGSERLSTQKGIFEYKGSSFLDFPNCVFSSSFRSLHQTMRLHVMQKSGMKRHEMLIVHVECEPPSTKTPLVLNSSLSASIESVLTLAMTTKVGANVRDRIHTRKRGSVNRVVGSVILSLQTKTIVLPGFSDIVKCSEKRTCYFYKHRKNYVYKHQLSIKTRWDLKKISIKDRMMLINIDTRGVIIKQVVDFRWHGGKVLYHNYSKKPPGAFYLFFYTMPAISWTIRPTKKVSWPL